MSDSGSLRPPPGAGAAYGIQPHSGPGFKSRLPRSQCTEPSTDGPEACANHSPSFISRRHPGTVSWSGRSPGLVSRRRPGTVSCPHDVIPVSCPHDVIRGRSPGSAPGLPVTSSRDGAAGGRSPGDVIQGRVCRSPGLLPARRHPGTVSRVCPWSAGDVIQGRVCRPGDGLPVTSSRDGSAGGLPGTTSSRDGSRDGVCRALSRHGARAQRTPTPKSA
jgi:hypothetical protein